MNTSAMSGTLWNVSDDECSNINPLHTEKSVITNQGKGSNLTATHLLGHKERMEHAGGDLKYGTATLENVCLLLIVKVFTSKTRTVLIIEF